MPSIAKIVEQIVKRQPYLEEAIIRKIINFSALAETVKLEVETALGQTINTSAIVMALRRYAQKIDTEFLNVSSLQMKDADITIRSDLFEITVRNDSANIQQLKTLYGIVDLSQGDFLAITNGNYEITIISNVRHKKAITSLFTKNLLIKTIDNLSSVSLKIPLDAINNPGMFYLFTKALAWENISIIEIVSTLSEMTFILNEYDIPRAFNIMKETIASQNQ